MFFVMVDASTRDGRLLVRVEVYGGGLCARFPTDDNDDDKNGENDCNRTT